MAKTSRYLYVALFLMLLSGCGGGTTAQTPLPVNKAIILSTRLKPGLTGISVPIKAIEVSFVLPQTVMDPNSTAGALDIGETGLKNLNAEGYIPSGSYDSATRTVRFILLPNNIITSDLGIGDIARFTYETASGTTLSAQDIQPLFKVSGLGNVDISSEIEPSVHLVTYQKP